MNIRMLLLPIVLMACTEDFKEDTNTPEDTGSQEEEEIEVGDKSDKHACFGRFNGITKRQHSGHHRNRSSLSPPHSGA